MIGDDALRYTKDGGLVLREPNDITLEKTIKAMAKRFRAVRDDLGLSQQDFASQLDISARAQQNYERGERKIPADVLHLMATSYRIDPMWMMEGPEERPRQLAAVGLDRETLACAIERVVTADKQASTKLSNEQFASVVASVYQFYMDNASRSGADDLVKSLIRALF